jgi:hypothetical protein
MGQCHKFGQNCFITSYSASSIYGRLPISFRHYMTLLFETSSLSDMKKNVQNFLDCDGKGRRKETTRKI